MTVTVKTDCGDEAADINVLEKGNSFFVVRAAYFSDDAPDEEKFIAVKEVKTLFIRRISLCFPIRSSFGL